MTYKDKLLQLIAKMEDERELFLIWCVIQGLNQNKDKKGGR